MLKYHVAVCDDEKSDLDGKVEQKIGIINRKYHRRYNLWKKKRWEL